MKFALFHEIRVAQPLAGFDSFWSVEHHVLEEYSHCSNPEVLYGAVAAKTSRMRIGYGVQLGPKPYNHPVRSAESAAMPDLISDGRVEFGTGLWLEAVGQIVHCWTNDIAEFSGACSRRAHSLTCREGG